MFDILKSTDTARELVVSTVYYSLRLIKHRQGPGGQPWWTLEDLAEECSAAELALVENVIREIEAHEGMPLANLEEAAAFRYGNLLNSIVEQRQAASYGRDPSRGKQLLQELRAAWDAMNQPMSAPAGGQAGHPDPVVIESGRLGGETDGE